MRTLRQHRKNAGFTLVEIAIVAAIISIMVAFAVPQFSQWNATQRVRSAGRSLADSFSYARSQAMRTGRNHIVFISVPGVATADAAGNAIADDAGTAVPLLVIDDGVPGSGNCHIDAGERVMNLAPVTGVNWGVTRAALKAPEDTTAAPLANAITFANPDTLSASVNAVLFKPDGVPVTFSANGAGCVTIGETGSGRGGVYVTNGDRDYAAVLNALGGVRLHAWDRNASDWRS